jgi:alpha-N-arabinofuranosidase
MLATCVSLAMPISTAFAAPPIRVTIDGASRTAPVTKYEYGMFIEPIGGLVARTLWAEMLDDRKFYYPVVAPAFDKPPPLNAEGRPGVSYRKWRPIGGDNAVIMDTKAPYVGEQSPRIALDATMRKGLSQAGIGLAKGKRYDGYVVLAGDPGAKVEVALVWGPGPNDRQTLALPAPGADWGKAEISFTLPSTRPTRRWRSPAWGRDPSASASPH